MEKRQNSKILKIIKTNMKLNKKVLYSLTCLALSIASFLSWSFWMNVVSKMSPINDFDWFMFSRFNWLHASLDISFFGPLIFGALFLFFAMYLGITGAKSYDNQKKGVLISVSLVTYLSILLLLFALTVVFVL